MQQGKDTKKLIFFSEKSLFYFGLEPVLSYCLQCFSRCLYDKFKWWIIQPAETLELRKHHNFSCLPSVAWEQGASHITEHTDALTCPATAAMHHQLATARELNPLDNLCSLSCRCLTVSLHSAPTKSLFLTHFTFTSFFTLIHQSETCHGDLRTAAGRRSREKGKKLFKGRLLNTFLQCPIVALNKHLFCIFHAGAHEICKTDSWHDTFLLSFLSAGFTHSQACRLKMQVIERFRSCDIIVLL